MVWEAGKVHDREEYVSSIKAVGVGLMSHTTQLEECEETALELFTGHPTPENNSTLAQARRDLKLHYTSLVQSDARKFVAKLFE